MPVLATLVVQQLPTGVADAAQVTMTKSVHSMVIDNSVVMAVVQMASRFDGNHDICSTQSHGFWSFVSYEWL